MDKYSLAPRLEFLVFFLVLGPSLLASKGFQFAVISKAIIPQNNAFRIMIWERQCIPDSDTWAMYYLGNELPRGRAFELVTLGSFVSCCVAQLFQFRSIHVFLHFFGGGEGGLNFIEHDESSGLAKFCC